jgi:Rrf2 family protein
MRLSHTCVYALHALEHLASEGGGRPVTARDIAEARGAPERYLMKVLTPLVSAGVLRSLKGPNGGFRLARAASQITLLEVVEAVDGPLRAEAPRVAGVRDGLDSRLEGVCERVAEEVRRRLGQVRLSDLAGKQ